MKKYKIIRSTQNFLLGRTFECDELTAEKLTSLLGIPMRDNKVLEIERGLYRYLTVHYTLIIKEVN